MHSQNHKFSLFTQYLSLQSSKIFGINIKKKIKAIEQNNFFLILIPNIFDDCNDKYCVNKENLWFCECIQDTFKGIMEYCKCSWDCIDCCECCNECGKCCQDCCKCHDENGKCCCDCFESCKHCDGCGTCCC